MNQISEDYDEENSFIKPIKILSPVNKQDDKFLL